MNAQSRPLLGDGGEWIFNAIKRNPEGLLLLAAGAVLMMRTSSPQSSQAASIDATYGPTQDAASKPASQMADAVTDTARRTMDAASSYASAASDTARQTMDAAKSYASSAGESPTRRSAWSGSSLIGWSGERDLWRKVFCKISPLPLWPPAWQPAPHWRRRSHRLSSKRKRSVPWATRCQKSQSVLVINSSRQHRKREKSSRPLPRSVACIRKA